MVRASRSSVNGVSRSERPRRQTTIVIDSPSTSLTPEPATRSPLPKRQKSFRLSMTNQKGETQEVLYRTHDPQINETTLPLQTEKTQSAEKEQAPRQLTKPLVPTASSKIQLNSPDNIEEYIFSSDDEDDIDDTEDMMDTRSHISLSSDDPPPDQQGIDTRPWLSMSDEQRTHYESMFVNVTQPAIGQSWSYTEEYQAQIDRMMLAYVEDFPLSAWMVGEAVATRAYHYCNQRTRWRLLGVRIYGADRLPDIFQPRVSYTGPTPTGAQPIPHPQHMAPPGTLPPTHVRPPSRQSQIHQEHVVPPTVIRSTVPAQPIPTEDSKFPQSSPPIDLTKPVQTHGHPRQRTQKAMVKTTQKKVKEVEAETPTPVVVPPYPVRARPDRKPIGRAGRTRRLAEAKLFAWNREMDFQAAQEAATWDDSIYDPKTLEAMAEVRKHNAPIIERLDREVTEKQRLSRNSKRQQQQSSDGPIEAQPRPGRKKKDPNDKSESNDPYHAGYFAYATAEIEDKWKPLGYHNPDYVLRAAEADKLTLDELETIKLCWNPGRKGLTYDLTQAVFSARDTVLTRRQLAKTPILTRRAAECIIDFSPDYLWRDILLRICSEAGCGNKDVRERFCLNGCHADKATFTKRISAALGQKQTQGKTKGYAQGEWEFYEASGEDFKNYIEFFGKRSTTRNMKVGLKRRYGSNAADGTARDEEGKPLEADADIGSSSMSIAPSDDAVMEDAEQEPNDDAVSAQDSDALDMLSD
ncbi:hypothetical protein AMS68_003517 [Peltaster fructicola]|uniref:Uncharacterized protein n=1 Tax=Peltaster fructicola TaxID=286661 RepID=A0A6H0XU73_9PEZI|nr:hypothetical protein AMS68_003517 [Peltaster fructicola]